MSTQTLRVDFFDAHQFSSDFFASYPNLKYMGVWEKDFPTENMEEGVLYRFDDVENMLDFVNLHKEFQIVKVHKSRRESNKGYQLSDWHLIKVMQYSEDDFEAVFDNDTYDDAVEYVKGRIQYYLTMATDRSSIESVKEVVENASNFLAELIYCKNGNKLVVKSLDLSDYEDILFDNLLYKEDEDGNEDIIGVTLRSGLKDEFKYTPSNETYSLLPDGTFA